MLRHGCATSSTTLSLSESIHGCPSVTTHLRVLGDWVIIDPLYDPEKFGSLYLPNAFENKYPHQGDIIAAGPEFPFQEGTRVALRPFVTEPVKIGSTSYLCIKGVDIVGRIEGRELYPKPTQILVLPDWSEKYSQPSETIVLSVTEQELSGGLTRGTVARVGEKVTLVKPGDEVLFPPNRGTEIGFIDTNWYVFEEDELLATLTRA